MPSVSIAPGPAPSLIARLPIRPAQAASVITTATVNIESHLTLSNNYAPGLPAETR